MRSCWSLCVLLCAFLVSSPAFAALELVSYSFGGSVPNASSYDWWYGCSPTSAGMLISWYDRNGYSNLVPGGEAETSTFGNPGALVNSIIASNGHISDFYSNGYNISGDDAAPPFHSFDCLADFMGTSQDAYGNNNGFTKFYFYADNSPLTSADIYSYGSSYYNSDGMYGIGEYIQYGGYDTATLYSQRIYGYNGIEAGFTYEQYKAEIDAGRGVLIHVEGHTMYGYGYIDGTDTIQVYDTWPPAGQNPGTMVWGGSYSSMAHCGVTVVQVIPEPITMVLLAFGSMLLRRRK